MVSIELVSVELVAFTEESVVLDTVTFVRLTLVKSIGLVVVEFTIVDVPLIPRVLAVVVPR